MCKEHVRGHRCRRRSGKYYVCPPNNNRISHLKCVTRRSRWIVWMSWFFIARNSERIALLCVEYWMRRSAWWSHRPMSFVQFTKETTTTRKLQIVLIFVHNSHLTPTVRDPCREKAERISFPRKSQMKFHANSTFSRVVRLLFTWLCAF